MPIPHSRIVTPHATHQIVYSKSALAPPARRSRAACATSKRRGPPYGNLENVPEIMAHVCVIKTGLRNLNYIVAFLRMDPCNMRHRKRRGRTFILRMQDTINSEALSVNGVGV